ncbi:hypothetical protein ALC53_04083 [Atta colombica]|uniref:Uncharacterized protein n=1 Tax=Atta colombica TaxID=520822 RepID=A0A195BMK6_9HYME|nr:hypothetical protein ALC53_04083 [Atta colombica]
MKSVCATTPTHDTRASLIRDAELSAGDEEETHRRRRETEAEKSGGESGVNEDESGEECGGDEERRDRRRQHFWNTRGEGQTAPPYWNRYVNRSRGWERQYEYGVKDERLERERERKGNRETKAEANGTSLCKLHISRENFKQF